MKKTEWVRCPACGNKTRLQLWEAETEIDLLGIGKEEKEYLDTMAKLTPQ